MERSPGTRSTLRCNAASRMKILFYLCFRYGKLLTLPLSCLLIRKLMLISITEQATESSITTTAYNRSRRSYQRLTVANSSEFRTEHRENSAW